MALQNKTERAKQYLIGTMDAADKARFEEEYFTDDELFEEVEIAEDELIDAYIRHELNDIDLNRFETTLVSSPRLAEKIEFARTLTKATGRSSPLIVDTDQEPFWRRILFPRSLALTFATLALLLLFGGGVLFFVWLRLRTESTRLASERIELQQRNQTLALEAEKDKADLAAQLADARAENARLQEQLKSASQADQHVTQPDRTVALLLFPGSLRSTTRRNVLEISPQTTNAKLRLSLPSDDYLSYSATVKTAEQRTVWSKAQLKSRSGRNGKVIELSVPSSQLTSGTYLVELSGNGDSANSERLPDYSFQVIRKNK